MATCTNAGLQLRAAIGSCEAVVVRASAQFKAVSAAAVRLVQSLEDTGEECLADQRKDNRLKPGHLNHRMNQTAGPPAGVQNGGPADAQHASACMSTANTTTADDSDEWSQDEDEAEGCDCGQGAKVQSWALPTPRAPLSPINTSSKQNSDPADTSRAYSGSSSTGSHAAAGAGASQCVKLPGLEVGCVGPPFHRFIRPDASKLAAVSEGTWYAVRQPEWRPLSLTGVCWLIPSCFLMLDML